MTDKTIGRWHDGVEHARVPPTRDRIDAERRAQRCRTARANLAAMACDRFGVNPASPDDPEAVREAAEWFADLTEVLGLAVHR